MITSLIIAFVITFIICLLVKIRTRDIVLVCAISTLLVLLLEKIYDADNKLTNFMLNTKLPFFSENQKNNFSQPNVINKTQPKDCGIMGCPIERLIPKKYGEIIPEDMYNPEDCTNDGSCLQKSDENNLFPGFCNSNFKEQIKNLDFKISKMENNISNMKNDEGIFVEHFQNDRTPQELNDTILSFNKTILKPYESNFQSNSKIESQDMMETDGICFHGKIGVCEGGVCKSLEDKHISGTNTHTVEQSKMALSAHPYTDEQPFIRITNPGQHDFE